jgi:adenosylcobinamide-phosphate synthase
VALALDLTLGEPPNRWHPVAWFGAAASRLERSAPGGGPSARLAYGAAMTSLLVGAAGAAGLAVERALARAPAPARPLLAAAALKSALSVRALADAATQIADHLEAGRVGPARSGLRALVSRPTAEMGPAAVASAAIESVAENLSDSLVAPLLAYLAFGLPGAFAYRAINTLDAMIGYRGEYEQLGKSAARLDDLANLAPARLSVALLVLAATLGSGHPGRAVKVLLRDHARTASPNAGWPMSAAAGALGVRLEKLGHYVLGAEFPRPTATDIRRVIRLYHVAAMLAVGWAPALILRWLVHRDQLQRRRPALDRWFAPRWDRGRNLLRSPGNTP